MGVEMAKQSKARSRRATAQRKSSREPAHAAPSFADIAWRVFDPATVAAILTEGGSEAFPHQHELLLRAFGGWVIAPANDKMRKLAIRIGVRHWLADAEKAVLRKPPEGWAKADVEARQTLGDDFLREAYYGLGGAAVLGSSSSSTYRSRVKRSQLDALETFIEVLESAHRVYLSDDSKKSLKPSTINSYFNRLKPNCEQPNLTLRSSKKDEDGTKGVLLKYDSLRRKKYLDVPRAVLTYAAFLTHLGNKPVESDRPISGTLLEKFMDPDWKLDFDGQSATQAWLSSAVFIRDKILPIFDGDRFELTGGPFDDSDAAARFVQGLRQSRRKPPAPRPSPSREKALAKSTRR
ncbi:hypothetical protein [Paracoccus sp. S1E-3]|uniref:hypothetical protein n=2 Tax=Paracoccus TaxID=265 RepID=UPI0015EFBEB6|nr:hypothetical protein [Paracoccus sp. S1E-3]MBA4492104.1 hypothetical protein [Paracoccus sp. S1E-3]